MVPADKIKREVTLHKNNAILVSNRKSVRTCCV